MANIAMNVWIAWIMWLFALWWLITAFRGYTSHSSPRYKNLRACYLALIAMGQLAWLGYLLLQAVTPLVCIVQVAFGLTWWLWKREDAFYRLYSEGTRLQKKGRFEEAYVRFEQAFHVSESCGNNERKLRLGEALGGIRFLQGRLDDAARHWEQALSQAIRHKKMKGIDLLNGLLGAAYLERGLIQQARFRLERSREFARDGKIKAHALQNLASVYAEIGEGEKAIKALREAQLLYERHGDLKQAADQWSNLGRVYRLLCDYPQYVDCATRQEALKKSRIYFNEAYHFYENWLQQHERYWQGYSSHIVPPEIRESRKVAANALGSIADIYRLEKEWEKARDYYEQQLEFGRGITLLEDLSGLALCYLELAQTSKAYETINRAFEVNQRDRQQQDPRTEYLLHFRRGYLHERNGQSDNACLDYGEAMERLDSLRQRVERRDEQGVLWQRIGLLTQSERTEAAQRLILLRLDQRDWQAAFNVLERSRAQAFLEELSFSRGSSPLKPADYKTIQDFIDGFSAATALVEFYTMLEDIIVFIIKSREKQPTVIRLRIPQRELQNYIGDPNIEKPDQIKLRLSQFVESSLAESLLRKVLPHLQGVELVYLVPHGPLHYLPLHALRVDGDYLIDRFSIVYSPSAAVLDLVVKRKGKKAWTRQSKALVMGNPTLDLPFAESEAKHLAEFLGVQPYLREEATKHRIQSEIPGKNIVHLACHGCFYPPKPLLSYIQLADKEEPTTSEKIAFDSPASNNEIRLPHPPEPKDLTGEEIMTWQKDRKLQADLVVLSACETGQSEVNPGDEPIGLTRALLVAGAATVLGSLWSVDSISTTLLMERFYENYLHGDPDEDPSTRSPLLPVEALRRTQIWLRDRVTVLEVNRRCEEQIEKLESTGEIVPEWLSDAAIKYASQARKTPDEHPFAHPYYWSPFILSGAL